MTLSVGRVASMVGEIRPPSDKSLTHRAYMLAALAEGDCSIFDALDSEDCRATLACLDQLGVKHKPWTFFTSYTAAPSTQFPGSQAWQAPATDLNCGNSGTTMRLLSGLIASREMEATLVGDESLSMRPMGRIAAPLRLMGADVEGDTPPLRIKGGRLKGIRYESPVASAQVKSCVLLAGLSARGETWVSEPSPSRDHTERMLEALGVEILRDGNAVGLIGGTSIPGFSFHAPADISSAAFFMVAAALVPESQLRLEDVGVNPTRTGILDVFEAAGIRVSREDEQEELNEPRADLEVVPNPVPLAFEIGGALVPRLIDEIPVLAVMATQCDGVTQIRDAAELRVKESDRIQLIVEGLTRMGAKVEPMDDGMKISGPTKLSAAEIDAHGDHRIAMAFAIAGLLAEGQTKIHGAETIASSYPNFEEDLWRVAVV